MLSDIIKDYFSQRVLCLGIIISQNVLKLEIVFSYFIVIRDYLSWMVLYVGIIISQIVLWLEIVFPQWIVIRDYYFP